MKCTICHGVLPTKVCRSAAGYYVGRFCDLCGPQGRDTRYFARESDAFDELVNILFHPLDFGARKQLRSTEWVH